MSCQCAHISYHLRRPQAIHGNLALRSSKLECSGGRGRGRVDDLDKIIFELAAILERAANKVCVGRSTASVEPRAGEVEDGRDTI